MATVKQENRWARAVKETLDHREDMRRQQEAAFMVRAPRQAPANPLNNHSRMQVRSWMRRNASEYEGATQLAEAANCALRLPFGAMDDETHWVWDEAFSAMECAM